MSNVTNHHPRNLILMGLLLISAAAASAVDRSAWLIPQITSANSGLSAADLAEKYGLMQASPFVFYRGTDHLWWTDYGLSAQLSTYGGTAATRTWLQGDLHVNNLGSFDNDQGTVVYDLNDFDEAVVGDYQLDLWRCAVSLVLVARENGFSAADQAAFLDSFTEHYLDAVAGYAGNSGETTATFTASNTYGQLDDFLVDIASSNSRTRMLNDWTVKVGGVRVLDTAGNPDLAPVTPAVDAAIRAAMPAYGATLSGGLTYSSSYFAVKSIAQRLHAGVGSLGTTRYYVLIEGSSTGQDNDRILDVKLQGQPAAWNRASAAAQTTTTNACGGNHARRAVTAYKALGYRVDDHLGWMTLSGATYSVRERSPFKGTLDTTTLNSFDRMTKLSEQWGTVIATAHARADKDADPAVIPGSFDSEVNNRTNGQHAQFRALVRSIALAYATQVEDDYASFVAWRLANGG